MATHRFTPFAAKTVASAPRQGHFTVLKIEVLSHGKQRVECFSVRHTPLAATPGYYYWLGAPCTR
jgi:hypothetical protein